jgi:hypothetical protein
MVMISNVLGRPMGQRTNSLGDALAKQQFLS